MSRVVLRSALALGAIAAAIAFSLAVTQGAGHETAAGRVMPALENDTSPLLRRPVRPSGRVAAPYVADRARAPGDPSFGEPTIAGIQGVGFEEDLRLDPSANGADRVYTSVPGSLSSDTSWIWRSLDGGKTFKWVPSAADKTGKPEPCAGGGDSELATDATGSVYFNDLTLANFSTARSDNQGQTFAPPLCSNTGVPDTAVDRQWYAVDGDPKIGSILGTIDPTTHSANSLYLANDEIGPGAVTCPISGPVNNVLAMYRSPSPIGGPATAGVEFGPAAKVTAVMSCDEGIMGNNEVSPVLSTTGEVGQPALASPGVHHVYVIHDDASFSKIRIGRCFPVLYGAAPVANTSDPSGLRCNDLPVADLGDSATVRTGGNFPTMAIDSTGNLYAVWEQAPVTPGATEKIGDTQLKYSYSTDEGTTWSAPMTVPTSGLNNNVMAWIGAGDDGRVDIAWYGTSATVNASDPDCPRGGPDAVHGIWSLYMVQSLNAHAASPTFTAPILAGEHYVHKGTIQTVIGHQCGDRTLGDFFQLRIGRQGEANISFGDSNNIDELFAPHAMYIRQNGGTSVLASLVPVTGDPIQLNLVTDPSGDGVYEAAGVTSANDQNLDILSSNISKPAAASCNPSGTACYRVQMTVGSLSATPTAPIGDSDTQLVWSTQWLVPADPACTSTNSSCTTGGKNFHVYAEIPVGGVGGVKCFVGENAVEPLGGGVSMTYPGNSPAITGAACSYLPGTPGTITIDVPISRVSLQSPTLPLSPDRLYSVTASTMTLDSPAETPPSIAGIGGNFFNLVDVARGYDVNFGSTAVTLRSLSAVRVAGAVAVRWRTATESNVLGFNVYRERNGSRIRLNKALIPARQRAGGAAYLYRDRLPARLEAARYWLQAVEIRGARVWLDSVRVR